MEAQTSLRRPTREVVLNAVAGEHVNAAIVHVNREVNDEFALDLAQDLAEAILEIKDVSRPVELLLGDDIGTLCFRHLSI